MRKFFFLAFLFLAGLFLSRPAQAAPLANNNVNIDSVLFDRTGGVFTDYTVAAQGPAGNVVLASSTANTAHYVGMQYIFNKLTYNIATAGNATGTVAWEYWNGAWTALPGVTDNTNQFTVAGTNTVTFAPPADWATTTVSAVANRYWIRARTTGVYAITQPLANQISAVEFNAQVTMFKMNGVTPLTGLNAGNFIITGGVDNTIYAFRELNAPSGIYQGALTADTHNYAATSSGYVNVPPTGLGAGALTTALTAVTVTMRGDLLFQGFTCGLTLATVCSQPLPISVAIAGTTDSAGGFNTFGFAAPTGAYNYTISSPGYVSVSGTVNAVSGIVSQVSPVLNLPPITGGSTVSPPVISLVTATTTSNSATISWTTDKSTSSTVIYGLSSGSYLNQPSPDATLVTSHSFTLTGLSPYTTYYYQVISSDSSGNKTVSQAYSFATLTFSPSSSPTPTPSASPSTTPTPTPTPTPLATLTPSVTPVSTPTPSISPIVNPSPSPAATPLPISIITRNLYLGVQDKEVEVLQRFLAEDKTIYPEGLITGYFGRLTQVAVKRFQARYGISQVGVVGPITRVKINKLLLKGE